MDNIIKQELMSCICDMYCKHPQEMTESELEIECSICRIIEIVNSLDDFIIKELEDEYD